MPDTELEISEEDIEAFFKRHANDTDPEESFWWMSPLCPPQGMDAVEAMQKLHRELQKWIVENKEGYLAEDIEFWDEETAKKKGHVYLEERSPLVQIAWLTGPENWPIGLMNGRSFGNYTFKHNGKEYYLEPADGYVLSLEFLGD